MTKTESAREHEGSSHRWVAGSCEKCGLALLKYIEQVSSYLNVDGTRKAEIEELIPGGKK